MQYTSRYGKRERNVSWCPFLYVTYMVLRVLAIGADLGRVASPLSMEIYIDGQGLMKPTKGSTMHVLLPTASRSLGICSNYNT